MHSPIMCIGNGVPAVLNLARDPRAAKAKAIAARDRVRERQRQMVNTLKKHPEA